MSPITADGISSVIPYKSFSFVFLRCQGTPLRRAVGLDGTRNRPSAWTSMFVASFVVACGPVRSLGHFCPFLHIPPAIVQRRAKGRNARQVSGLSERWSMRDLVSSSPMPALCLSASCLSSLGKTLRFQFRGDFLPFFVLFKAAVTFVLKNRRPLRAEARARPCDADSFPATMALREKHTCILPLLAFLQRVIFTRPTSS